MEYVQEVQKQIADMGFQGQQPGGLDGEHETAVQHDTGCPHGIGAVSLSVAAIGTCYSSTPWMMSIYERTKETVMKVLGRDMGNIRKTVASIELALSASWEVSLEFFSVTVSRWLSTGL